MYILLRYDSINETVPVMENPMNIPKSYNTIDIQTFFKKVQEISLLIVIPINRKVYERTDKLVIIIFFHQFFTRIHVEYLKFHNSDAERIY